MNISMFYIGKGVNYTLKDLLTKLLEYFKQNIYEKHVPEDILEKLKSYNGRLSLVQPPIDNVNRHLESDIFHTNSRETLLQIRKLRSDCPQYISIKILEWYDTIEWYELKDRVFVVEVKTNDPHKQAAEVYNVKLSTILF